ncbi:hypothetical protein [uncultured Sphaerochaeta sp.]|uniref:hypothetical protein n=1 Tax=uncultured Sphaerochaeta sp. TaxID=886478 RepID=UPI002616E488|nr:hypothetical protein [uncultured Sphaerochaeta sp.]
MSATKTGEKSPPEGYYIDVHSCPGYMDGNDSAPRYVSYVVFYTKAHTIKKRHLAGSFSDWDSAILAAIVISYMKITGQIS